MMIVESQTEDCTGQIACVAPNASSDTAFPPSSILLGNTQIVPFTSYQGKIRMNWRAVEYSRGGSLMLRFPLENISILRFSDVMGNPFGIAD